MKSVIRVQRKEVDQVKTLLGADSSHSRMNYQLKNYKDILSKQSENREKRKALSQPLESPFKLQRFAHVGSLVFKGRQEIEAIREGKRSRVQLLASRAEEQPLEQVVELSSGPKNFLRENAHAVIHSPPRPAVSRKAENAKALNPSYGRVPSYLNKYNQAAEAEAERRRLAKESKAPPGMRLLSEPERLEMYSAMEEQKRQTILALNRVPLGATAPSILKVKDGLERKLEDLERNLLIFARPKVYVEL